MTNKEKDNIELRIEIARLEATLEANKEIIALLKEMLKSHKSPEYPFPAKPNWIAPDYKTTIHSESTIPTTYITGTSQIIAGVNARDSLYTTID